MSYTSKEPFGPRGSRRALQVLCALFAVTASGALLAADGATANLSLGQILERHVSARGGLQSWRAVQALAVAGKLDAGSADSEARSRKLARQGLGVNGRHAAAAAAASQAEPAAATGGQVQLPFRLELKRPNKSRLELDFAGSTAVQVFDGEHGWKLRPFLNRDDAEAFTPEEAKTEAGKSDLEPPLVDYAAKGTRVALEGSEGVEGHPAYKLKLTLKSGEVEHVWLDARSFLDVKVEGIPRRMDGKVHKVFVYQRDFHAVQGLMVPFVYETAVEGYPQTHRMIIDKVNVNPSLADSRFSKPQLLAAATPAAAAVGASPAR